MTYGTAADCLSAYIKYTTCAALSFQDGMLNFPSSCKKRCSNANMSPLLLSAVSGRHGSIASCASLPNSHSLPQHDLASPAMSSEHSQAQSSGIDGHVGVLHSPAVSSISAVPDNRLKQHRSASWGPQSGTHLEEVTL